MIAESKLIEYPDVRGMEWREEGSSTWCSLSVTRGSSQVIFGMKSEANPSWSTLVIVDPTRFGSIPTTRKQFIAYWQNFTESRA